MAFRFLMAPHRFSSLPRTHRTYLSTITVAGACSVLLSLSELFRGSNSHGVARPRSPDSREWIGSYSVYLDSRCPVSLRNIRFHVGDTFRTSRRNPYCSNRRSGDFVLVLQERSEKLLKVVFNVCALPLTIWLAAHLMFAAGGFSPLYGSKAGIPLKTLLGPLLLCTLVYFLLSSWIITFAIALRAQPVASSNMARQFCVDIIELLRRCLSSCVDRQLYT